MRVIAGKARSIPLVTPKGMNTRPTTDRIKETLFNIIQTRIPECTFLDLFAGSGSIGIEALSRGASECVFVDQNRNAAACIQENLKKTKLASQGQILTMDVLMALKQLNGRRSFDCIFMDPPYQTEPEEVILAYLAESTLISDDTLIIIEATLNRDFSFVEELPFQIVRDKRYKTNRHLFVRLKDK